MSLSIDGMGASVRPLPGDFSVDYIPPAMTGRRPLYGVHCGDARWAQPKFGRIQLAGVLELGQPPKIRERETIERMHLFPAAGGSRNQVAVIFIFDVSPPSITVALAFGRIGP